jgi:hypothetical protein
MSLPIATTKHTWAQHLHPSLIPLPAYLVLAMYRDLQSSSQLRAFGLAAPSS